MTESFGASLGQRTKLLMMALMVFALSYPLTNLYAHHLQLHNPSMVMSVASRYDVLPFVAWAIVPYALSFVLFVVSFYLVPPAGLSLLLYRLLISTLMACLCFYLFPLKFSFDKPFIPEQWRWAYEILHAVDRPYNQLPSLHVCYATIFWLSLRQVMNEGSSSVWWRALYHLGLSVVCVAIASATLLTWQHHLADVVGGLLLAMAVVVAGRWLMKLPTLTAQAVMKFWVFGVLWFLWWAIISTLFFDGFIGLVFVAVYGLISFWLMAYLYLNPSWVTKILPKHAKGSVKGQFVGRFGLCAYVFGLPIMMVYQVMWQVAWRGGFVCRDVKARMVHTPRFDVMAIGHLCHEALERIAEEVRAYQKVVWLDVCAEMPSDFGIIYKKIHATTDDEMDIDWHYINLGVMDLQHFNEQMFLNIHVVHKMVAQEPSIKTLVICQCAMGQSRSVAVMMCLLMLAQANDSQQMHRDKHCCVNMMRHYDLPKSYQNHRAWRLLSSCTHYC